MRVKGAVKIKEYILSSPCRAWGASKHLTHLRVGPKSTQRDSA